MDSHPRWMLCLDASAPRTCVALGKLGADDDRDDGDHGDDTLLVGDDDEDGANQSSERLHARLRQALVRADLRPRDLAFVACGRGPGTFTGSRVAVATAKGLALGLGVPVVPVSTLAALAASDPRLDDAQGSRQVLALLDARRGQVYGARFEIRVGVRVGVGVGVGVAASVRAIDPERVIELATLLADIEIKDLPDLPDLLAFGPGCGPYAEQMPASLRARSQVAPGPDARGLWRASVSALRAGAAVDPEAFTVAYLRESYAEMGIHKPKRPVYRSPFV